MHFSKLIIEKTEGVSGSDNEPDDVEDDEACDAKATPAAEGNSKKE